jgi:hypothetical protein
VPWLLLGIDAIKMIGSEILGDGQTLSSGVVYVPPVGITLSALHGVTAEADPESNFNTMIDSFGFKASDCLAEAAESTIVAVLPATSASIWHRYTMPIAPGVWTNYSIPLTHIYSCKAQNDNNPPFVVLLLMVVSPCW